MSGASPHSGPGARERRATSGGLYASSRNTCAVQDVPDRINWVGGPSSTISPPAFPPSGPKSRIQSAFRITSRLFRSRARYSVFHQPVQHVEQALHVRKMQPGRGLIQQVQGAARGPLGQLATQFHALRLATGQRRGGLPQLDVMQPDVRQRLQFPGNRRDVREKSNASAKVISRTSAILFPLCRTSSVSRLYRCPLQASQVTYTSGQKMHFDFEQPPALARLAPAALHVKL